MAAEVCQSVPDLLVSIFIIDAIVTVCLNKLRRTKLKNKKNTKKTINMTLSFEY